MSKEVHEIVKEYLQSHGFDGLCSDDCGCDIEDLMPCDWDMSGCVPAYKAIYDPEIHGNDLSADPGDPIYTAVPPKEKLQ